MIRVITDPANMQAWLVVSDDRGVEFRGSLFGALRAAEALRQAVADSIPF